MHTASHESPTQRILPRSGLSVVIFFAAVIALLNAGLILPARLDLLASGVASLAAGSWCSANFWRRRHAHCMITGAGWLTLAGFAILEAGLGRSLIHGDEGLVFLAVLGAGLLFEVGWYWTHGTNAVLSRSAQKPHSGQKGRCQNGENSLASDQAGGTLDAKCDGTLQAVHRTRPGEDAASTGTRRQA